MKHLTLLLSSLFFSFFIACNSAAPGTAHEVIRARSGGVYELITFTGFDVELMHPSANPEGPRYLLCLPLAAKRPKADAALPLAQLRVEDGRLHFDEVRAEQTPYQFYYVVKDGKAFISSNPKMEFRVVLLRMNSGDWKLAVGKKQYSLRQLAKDMQELGAVEAIEIPLTERVGWYRYAEVAFELRKDKPVAEDLLIFTARQR
jgi:hypothetical protein